MEQYDPTDPVTQEVIKGLIYGTIEPSDADKKVKERKTERKEIDDKIKELSGQCARGPVLCSIDKKILGY